MIASLRGTLLEKNQDGAVVEVNGIGYSVSLGASSLLHLPPLGEDVFLFIAESVGMYGGGVTLYGFLKRDEKHIFSLIKDHVPGIGAKKALELLDKAMKSLPDFRRAIYDKDARSLVSLFGFTPKTAEKTVTGLNGKLETAASTDGAGVQGKGGASSSLEEAIQGLVSLGYKESVARQAAQSAKSSLGDSSSSENLIRESLRHLSGRG